MKLSLIAALCFVALGASRLTSAVEQEVDLDHSRQVVRDSWADCLLCIGGCALCVVECVSISPTCLSCLFNLPDCIDCYYKCDELYKHAEILKQHGIETLA